MALRIIFVSIMLLGPWPARADISTLNWMAGCWSPDGKQPGSVEQWTAPAGGSMLGVARTVSDGKTVFFEFLRIVEQEDGRLELFATPFGQETIRFAMTAFGSQEVAFENPEHDFPQRILYRLAADGKLLGRIEGTVNGEPRTVDFPMTKTACANGIEKD